MYNKIGAKKYEEIYDLFVSLENNEISEKDFVIAVADVVNGPAFD